MRSKMTKQQFFKLCIETVEELRSSLFIPWDTGNLATNALKYRIENDTFHVWVDLNEAPYMPYTNEPWTSPKWNGKTNPNEGWWEVWCETFMNRLAQKLRGTLK